MNYFQEYAELAISLNIPCSSDIKDKYQTLLRLLDIYTLKYEVYIKGFNERNREVVSEKGSELYDIVSNIISYIDSNQEDLHPIRSLTAFREIDDLLTRYKSILKNNDDILRFRKCVNWIRRKY
jgi:hypothetical protein